MNSKDAATVLDLQALVRENARLKREVERLKLVMDGAQLGLWDWNVQTNAVVFNKRWKSMIGYEEHELGNDLATWEKVLCPDDAAYVYKVLQDHLEGRIPVYATEHRLRHKDGHWIWVLDIGRIVEWDAEGKPLRATGVHQDISARKELEMELVAEKERAEAANLAKSRFLANMSHEIRTPMHGILGAGRLMRNSPLNGDQTELVDLVVGSTEALLDIINDILDFSKIEAGRLDIERIPMNLERLIDNIVSLLGSRATQKGLSLEFDYPEALPRWILGDPTRIRQVLMNLIANAIKFTRQGSVSIDLSYDYGKDEKGFLSIAVRDTGIGMSADQLEVIFEQFHQGDASISRKYGGTGLGTTISKRLALLMGGDIHVTSEPGRGSTFVFQLPTVQTEPQQDTEPEAYSRNYRKTVILAEDNPINRIIAEKVLSGFGVETIPAHNGLEVLEKIGLEHDMVLMDGHMPIMDGITATQKLRKQGYDKPIVAFSANVLAESRRAYLEAGCDGLIPKPFTLAELVSELDRHFSESSP
ncbi:PAS domain-containing hybrid sensor histidine kinase/response regulator [Sulfidibacter corallicola]|uniref:histidine kinase n=1 Tax=Sulfidibacter corallicola TaxID=2818388 RepID=A0A8A4TFX5_SULCO|nr:PAS domain-containing hybrid sensor histidine kinase/response regulator [Sulfidibacter corallicola]QTD48427.1 PAS domain-containing protein [Sulfidibacter corallicola]